MQEYSKERKHKCLSFVVNHLCNRYSMGNPRHKKALEMSKGILSGILNNKTTTNKRGNIRCLIFLSDGILNEANYTEVEKDKKTFQKASEVLKLIVVDVIFD